MPHRRPLLISVLSVIAFAIGPGLVVLGVALLGELVLWKHMPALSSSDFPIVALLLGLFASSFLALGLIAIVAGRDFLELRERGRKISSLFTALWIPVCMALAIVGWNLRDQYFLMAAAVMGAFALFFLTYLQLRTTRSQFAKYSITGPLNTNEKSKA
jgi:amino acid permease